MKRFQIEFKWAIIMVLLFMAWVTLEKQLGFHSERLKWQVFFRMLFVFPSFLLYYLAIRDKKSNYYNSNMNWRQGFISSVVISFIIVIFSPLTQFLIYEFIATHYFDDMIALAVANKRLTLLEAQSHFNLAATIWQSISADLSFGVVIGAIVAYLLKTNSNIETVK